MQPLKNQRIGFRLFAKIAIPRPIDSQFDYSYDQKIIPELSPGDLVLVPFGRSKTVGCVLEAGIANPPVPAHFEIKEIISRLDAGFSIPADVLQLCKFGAEYYQYPIGEAIFSAYPVQPQKLLTTRKTKRNKKNVTSESVPHERPLNSEQKIVLDEMMAEISKKPDAIFLLEGVTGSGKTEVYIDLAKNILSKGQSVLILVPEIALTSHLKDRFQAALGFEVILWHSALSDGLRQTQWRSVREGTSKVIVGARSAVFAPLANLGLIIVDEEHDATYKQEDRFRYQARDLAIYRANRSKCPCVLGSATPSLESVHRAQEGRYHLLKLKNRHSKQRMPVVRLVSLIDEPLIEHPQVKTPFAQITIQTIQQVLDRGEQVMIYLNRRGFSQFMMCQDCGWIKKCSSCSISLTHYQQRRELRCHVCGVKEKIPFECEVCHSYELMGMGSGTEALEDELKAVLTGAKILRLDRDQITSQVRLDETLDSFRNLESNILIGTQMLVKGHDFPKVTCMVVVMVDMLLKWPDFRATERAYQTLIQVSGRSGRSELPGQVLIQGYDLNHPVIQVLTEEASAHDLIQQEMDLRRQLFYPPFSRFIRFRFEGADVDSLKMKSQKIIDEVRKTYDADFQDRILGPSEALLFKAKNHYRWDAYLKARTIEELIRTSKTVKKLAVNEGIQVTLDVDPYSA